MSTELARELIEHGIPVVVCTPHVRCGPKCQKNCKRELNQPPGWNTITAAKCDLLGFRPGVDVLAMVSGHGIDVVDIDSKCGASPNDLPAYDHYGIHRTPSGGWHYFVPSSGYGKLSPFYASGKVVGDYCGGTEEGGGRLLVYLPGSTRSKYAGKVYTVESALDIPRLLEAETDPALLTCLAVNGKRDTLPGAAATTGAEVQAFLAQHSSAPKRECKYGRVTLAGMLDEAGTAEAANGGRHGWAVRSCTRLVELMRAGCAWAKDYDELASTLQRIKPEGGTDIGLVMQWALGNATGQSGCGLHSAVVTDVTDVSDFSGGGGIDGGALLDDVHEFITRFVSLPSPEAAYAVTAWAVHAAVLDAFDTTPRLALLSPEPGSGKTRALEVLELLVPNPMPTFNASAAVLFRSMALEDDHGVSLRPTVLLDEADTIFGPRASKEHEDLRGFINAGYRRGANAQRAAIRGKSVVIETFPAFAAVVIAGLDDLPDTIMSRSIVIRMRRRSRSETVAAYRRRHYEAEGLQLARRISAWTTSKYEALSESVSDLPEGIEDRAADIWEPLILVGDTAGGHWSRRMREAAVALVGQAQGSGETLGIRLLTDLRTVFEEHSTMSTVDILRALNGLEDAPWGDLRGKPLDPRGLSQRLRKYGVKSKSVRTAVDHDVVKGYAAGDLHDPWSRYLPPPPEKSDTSVTSVTPLFDEPDAEDDVRQLIA